MKNDDVYAHWLPRPGAQPSELVLAEVAALQGWSLDDLAANRAGRLSVAQRSRLLQGHRDLFGLVHVRVAPKTAIEAGIVTAHEGTARSCQGMTLSGPSLKLTVDEALFFWTDEATYAGKQHAAAADVLALRLRLLEHWVATGQRVRVYALGESLVAVEPLPGDGSRGEAELPDRF